MVVIKGDHRQSGRNKRVVGNGVPSRNIGVIKMVVFILETDNYPQNPSKLTNKQMDKVRRIIRKKKPFHD